MTSETREGVEGQNRIEVQEEYLGGLEPAPAACAAQCALGSFPDLLALRPEVASPLDLSQDAGALDLGPEPVYETLRGLPLIEGHMGHISLLLT